MVAMVCVVASFCSPCLVMWWLGCWVSFVVDNCGVLKKKDRRACAMLFINVLLPVVFDVATAQRYGNGGATFMAALLI